MTTHTTKLRGHSRRHAPSTLDEAVRRASRGSKPIAVNLATNALPVADDEVVVVVVGRDRALVSRTHVRGRPVDLREMRLRLAGVEAAVEKVASSPRPDAPSLSAAEASLLDEAGFGEEPSDAVAALDRSRIDLEIMLGESLSLEEAAKALGLKTTSRLRQRLSAAERTLYGIKEGRGWRIPKFQFAGRGKLVRGIDKVLPRVRVDAHPIAVQRWFTSPHQDLVVGDDEHPVSPIAWLSAGGSTEEVAALAAEI